MGLERVLSQGGCFVCIAYPNGDPTPKAVALLDVMHAGARMGMPGCERHRVAYLKARSRWHIPDGAPLSLPSEDEPSMLFELLICAAAALRGHECTLDEFETETLQAVNAFVRGRLEKIVDDA